MLVNGKCINSQVISFQFQFGLNSIYFLYTYKYLTIYMINGPGSESKLKAYMCHLFQFVHQDGYSYKSDVHFVRYMTGTSYNPLKDKSGAYIFLPDRTAEVNIYGQAHT